MDTDNTFQSLGVNTKDTGRKIRGMERARKLGLTEPSSRDNTSITKNQGTENSSTSTEIPTQDR